MKSGWIGPDGEILALDVDFFRNAHRGRPELLRESDTEQDQIAAGTVQPRAPAGPNDGTART